MNKYLTLCALISVVCSCSNTPELETGEIKTLQMLKDAFSQSKNSNVFIDAKNLLSREQIDAASIPVLFVELESGQNGTLTPYPGQGDGEIWLGADGATITLDQGILKASRGMGVDVMGASSSMAPWVKLKNDRITYIREVKYITGNNKTVTHSLKCKIKKNDQQEMLKIWDVEFRVIKYDEDCDHNGTAIKNTYYLDDKEIVRRSFQYHSKALGYIVTERLDR